MERATAVLSGPGPLVGRITRGPPGPLAARRRHRLSKGRRHDYSGRRPRLEFSAEAASRRGQPTHRRRAAALAASRAHANPVAAEGGGASAWEELNPRGGALESNPPFLPLCGDESAAGDLPQLPARKLQVRSAVQVFACLPSPATAAAAAAGEAQPVWIWDRKQAAAAAVIWLTVPAAATAAAEAQSFWFWGTRCQCPVT